MKIPYPMREEFFLAGLIDLCEDMRNNFGGSLKDKTMIEIGAYAGDSTFVFSRYFGSVIVIDPFDKIYLDQDKPLKEYASMGEVEAYFRNKISDRNNVELMKMTSDEAIYNFEQESIDFVYIDGLHTYEQITKDIENYFPFVKEMGFIGGHDYTDEWKATKEAVIEKFPESQIAVYQDTSWITRKIELTKPRTVI